MTGLLIDLDGVLYESDKVIAGASDAVHWIGEQGIPHLFVTNTTSRPRSAIIDKLGDFGIAVDRDDILTPPVAAARWLDARVSRPVALFVAPATVEDFTGIEVAGEREADISAVVVGDYGERWNFAELNRAFRLLMSARQPLLVALGMTRYWKAEDGLRLDTAPFVAALSHASGSEPVVLGKPAREFFETALDILDIGSAPAVMIGDDIRGDIGGAQNAGLRGILVRSGKFRDEDLDGQIEPDLVIDTIADLPDVWADFGGG